MSESESERIAKLEAELKAAKQGGGWPKRLYKRGHEPIVVYSQDELKAHGFGYSEEEPEA